MNDFNEPGYLAPTGLYLGGTKYMVIQGEPGAVIRGKKVIFSVSHSYCFLYHLNIDIQLFSVYNKMFCIFRWCIGADRYLVQLLVF